MNTFMTAYPKEINDLPGELLQFWGPCRYFYHICANGEPILQSTALEVSKFLHEHFAKYHIGVAYPSHIIGCWQTALKNLPPEMRDKYHTIEIIQYSLDHYQETQNFPRKDAPFGCESTAYNFHLPADVWQLWGLGRFLQKEESSSQQNLPRVYYLHKLKIEIRKLLTHHLEKYKDILNVKECLTQWLRLITNLNIDRYMVIIPVWLAMIGYLERFEQNRPPLDPDENPEGDHHALICQDPKEQTIFVVSQKEYDRLFNNHVFLLYEIEEIRAGNEEQLKIAIGRAVRQLAEKK